MLMLEIKWLFFILVFFKIFLSLLSLCWLNHTFNDKASPPIQITNYYELGPIKLMHLYLKLIPLNEFFQSAFKNRRLTSLFLYDSLAGNSAVFLHEICCKSDHLRMEESGFSSSFLPTIYCYALQENSSNRVSTRREPSIYFSDNTTKSRHWNKSLYCTFLWLYLDSWLLHSI